MVHRVSLGNRLTGIRTIICKLKLGPESVQAYMPLKIHVAFAEKQVGDRVQVFDRESCKQFNYTE